MAKFTFKSYAVKELGGGAKGTAAYRKMRAAYLNNTDEKMLQAFGKLKAAYENHAKRSHKRATATKKHISKRKTSPGKMSSYNCFISSYMKEHSAKGKSVEKVRSIMKHGAKKWKKMSDAEKAKYKGKCAKKSVMTPRSGGRSGKTRTSLKVYIIKHLMKEGKSLCDAKTEYSKMRKSELAVFKEMRKAGKRKGTKRGVAKGTKRASPSAYACYVRKERKAGIELAAIRKAWKKLTKAQKASHKCEKLASPLKRKAASKKAKVAKKAKSPKKAIKKTKKAAPKKAKKAAPKKAKSPKKAKKSTKAKKVAKK